jgi:hypothetical protein
MLQNSVQTCIGRLELNPVKNPFISEFNHWIQYQIRMQHRTLKNQQPIGKVNPQKSYWAKTFDKR